jgi:hypothetical protein
MSLTEEQIRDLRTALKEEKHTLEQLLNSIDLALQSFQKKEAKQEAAA